MRKLVSVLVALAVLFSAFAFADDLSVLTDEELVVIDDEMSRESSEMISTAIMAQPGFYHVTDDAVLLGNAVQDLLVQSVVPAVTGLFQF